jgi:hypothetical protein
MLNLFLHPVASGRKIGDLYRSAFSEAEELYVMSAYLRTWDTTLKINTKCSNFAFIVGSDFGITRKQACRDVLKWLPPQMKSFFYVAQGISGFHPKALFWRNGGGQHYAIIGSSNLSEAGWSTNYEANAYDRISAEQFRLVKEWVERILVRSQPISKEWIEEYAEAAPSPNRKRNVKGTTNLNIATVKLPRFRGHAKIIRDRRRMFRHFPEIRDRLLNAVRRCASGLISSKKFYDTLEATWGSNKARVQGWGWQVTGRQSDFRAFCLGLVEIIDAPDIARDTTVVKVIDDLKADKVQTRRSLLSELLCLLYPDKYPILNEPVASYVRPFVKAPYGSSEGARYLHLALSLRAALRAHPEYPAKSLLELDGMIWEFERRKRQDS